MKQLVGKEIFGDLYRGFEMPLAELDCGLKCGPHNDYGVPVCCDIKLVVPSAFELEWRYLRQNTDLWQPWSSSGLVDLSEQVQDGQVLLECKGYQHCQRSFRTLTCRAFPFFPYFTSREVFSGMGTYRDFREDCWIISNLAVVTQDFKAAFQRTFNKVFDLFPDTRKNFQDFSQYIREEAVSDQEEIVVLDFQGGVGLVDPLTERVTPADFLDLPAYGPFAVARELPFPDEFQLGEDDQ